ncbi:MAG: tetratricopeptide repeat protein [Deltaproteobacteria bacterium]|nr:tetratricopeptide repeat protein [Deltaproteobacteria bacterium]
MDSKTSSRETILLLTAAVVVIFIYMGSLSGPFVFDDEPNITENRHIRLKRLSPEDVYAAAFNSPLPHRPVANASFALNYFFNGYNVVGYRFVNILIHIINGYLVYFLARFTLRTPALRGFREQAGAIACGAAILWLVHPLHTQSVAYIVQRMTSLTTLFYLLAMACYSGARLSTTTTRRNILLTLCAVSGLLALGTKEIAATLPIFIFLYEWFFFQQLEQDWLRRRLPALAGVCVAFGVIVLVFSGFENPVERIFAPYAGGGMTAWQRVMTQFRVVVFYLSLLFWPAPSRLNLDHDVAISLALFDPATTLFSLLFVAGLFAAAVLTARREPLGAYATLWFLGNLVIESSVIRLELIFDHRTYLPSVFPAIVLVSLVFRFLKQKWAAVALLAALAAGCSFWTWQRSHVWADEVALWRDCMEKSPLKPRPFNNLGSALSKIGRFEEAAAYLARAVKLKPNYDDARYNLGYVLVQLGQVDAGIRELLEAVRIEPRNHMALNNLGVAYLIQENYPDAVRHLQEALRLNPDFEAAHNNLGVALKNQGDLAGAIRQFSEAIRVNSNYAEAWNNLGVSLKEQGRLKEAGNSFRRALQISPNYAAARRNLEEAEKAQAPNVN